MLNQWRISKHTHTHTHTHTHAQPLVTEANYSTFHWGESQTSLNDWRGNQTNEPWSDLIWVSWDEERVCVCVCVCVCVRACVCACVRVWLGEHDMQRVKWTFPTTQLVMVAMRTNWGRWCTNGAWTTHTHTHTHTHTEFILFYVSLCETFYQFGRRVSGRWWVQTSKILDSVDLLLFGTSSWGCGSLEQHTHWSNTLSTYFKATQEPEVVVHSCTQ